MTPAQKRGQQSPELHVAVAHARHQVSIPGVSRLKLAGLVEGWVLHVEPKVLHLVRVRLCHLRARMQPALCAACLVRMRAAACSLHRSLRSAERLAPATPTMAKNACSSAQL